MSIAEQILRETTGEGLTKSTDPETRIDYLVDLLRQTRSPYEVRVVGDALKQAVRDATRNGEGDPSKERGSQPTDVEIIAAT